MGKFGKIAIMITVIIIVYYLLVYYKGGTAYVRPLSSAFNNGVSSLMARTNAGGATNYPTGG